MSTLRFAQLSDLHLYAYKDFVYHEHNTYQSFSKVIELLQEDVPTLDFILVTGDMASKQEKQVYFHVDEAFKPLNLPWYWLPGNHDSNKIMQAVANEVSVTNAKLFEAKGTRFILLNSLDREEKVVEGMLPTEELNFLRQSLEQAPKTPTIVALHHQPISLGEGWVEPLGLINKADFNNIIIAHSQVKAVIFGHVHHANQWEHNQIQYFSAPATSYQFNPYTPEFSLDDLAPGYRIFEVEGDSIKSEVKRISF